MKTIRIELLWFDHISGKPAFSATSILNNEGYTDAFKRLFYSLKRLYEIAHPPISNKALMLVIIKQCIKTIKSDRRLSLKIR
mgnify:FL=1